MAKINVNGTELNFNIMNARHIEAVATAQKELSQAWEAIKGKKPEETGVKGYVQTLKNAGKSITDCFDTAFGDGTVKKLGIDPDAYDECFKCFEELNAEIGRISAQKNEFAEYINKKYKPVK